MRSPLKLHNPLLRYPASARLLAAAAGAWASAGFGVSHPAVITVLLALSTVSTGCLLSRRQPTVASSPTSTRDRTANDADVSARAGGAYSSAASTPTRSAQTTPAPVLPVFVSCLLFAALAAAAVGAHMSFARAAPDTLDEQVLIVSDSQESASGYHRARADSPYGGLTLISRAPLPAAGSRTQITGTLEHAGPELTVFVNTTQVSAPPAWHWQVRAAVRTHLSQAAGTDHPGARLLPGLVIGDTSALLEDEYERLTAVSLTHITAVSGANISLVGVSVLALVRLLTPRKAVGLSAAVVCSAVYVFIVGPDPSVIRAAGMGLIAVVVMARGTGKAGLAMLALAVTALLILRPDLATSIGFILSVAATAALIVISTPLTNVLMRAGTPRFLAQLTAVPICAQLGVLPVLVVAGQAPGAWSVLANMTAAPAVGAATIAGLVVLLSLPLTLLPGGMFIAHVIALPGSLLGWWIMGVASFSESLPGAHSTWPAGLLGVLLAVIITIAGAAAILLTGRLRTITGLAAAAAIGAGVLIPLIITPLRSDWVMAACSVGQGSATAVRLHRDHALLIDTGDDPELLDDCLRSLRVKTVTLMISHFDRDHVGAAAEVPRSGRTLAGWYASRQETESAEAVELGGRLGVHATAVEQGSVLTQGEVRIEVLWPPPAAALDSNAGSLVLSLSLPAANGSFTAVVPGDIGEREQRRLSRSIAQADVLVSPHHGSADIDPGFFRAVGPQLGVVSVGENRYGHPTQTGLRAFGTAPVLRTDLCGTVIIAADMQAAGKGAGCAARLE